MSCVIYIIIRNYVCIDYLACESKNKWTTCFYWSGFKHKNKSYNKSLGIGIPDLFMNLMSCHGFFKKINFVVILKCPKRILEYYFWKVFTLFECNTINLEKLPNEVKYRIHAEDAENDEKVIICSTTISSTSNILKKLVVNTSFHSFYIQR